MKNLFTASFVLVCIALSAQETCEDLDTSSFLDVFTEQLITEMPKDTIFSLPVKNGIIILFLYERTGKVFKMSYGIFCESLINLQ